MPFILLVEYTHIIHIYMRRYIVVCIAKITHIKHTPVDKENPRKAPRPAVHQTSMHPTIHFAQGPRSHLHGDNPAQHVRDKTLWKPCKADKPPYQAATVEADRLRTVVLSSELTAFQAFRVGPLESDWGFGYMRVYC